MEELHREKIRHDINALYTTIKDAQDMIEVIRQNCDHSHTIVGDYMWRPGATMHGQICSACDKFMGDAPPSFLDDDPTAEETEVKTLVEEEMPNPISEADDDSYFANLKVIKSSQEWLDEVPAHFNLKIIEADGWKGDATWEGRITLQEFQRRLSLSTISVNRDFIEWAMKWE